MAHSEPFEQLTGTLTVYIAAVGTEIPPVYETPDEDWLELGCTDGEQSVQHAGSLTYFYDNCHQGPVKAVRPEEDTVLAFSLVGLTLENYASILHAAANVDTSDPAVETLGLERGFVPGPYALLFRGEALSPYGAWPGQYVIPRGVFDGEPQPTFAKDGRVALETEFRALEDKSQQSAERFGWLGVFVPRYPGSVWVGTRLLGVYATEDFPDPETGGQPTWATDNGGLPDMTLERYTLMRFLGSPRNQRNQMCIVRDTDTTPETRTIYTRSNAGIWAAALTEAQAQTIAGADKTLNLRDCVYDQLSQALWAIYSATDLAGPRYLLTNAGGSWALVYTAIGTFRSATLSVRGNEVAFGYGGASSTYMMYSGDGGASFTRGDGQTSIWQMAPHLFASGRLFGAGWVSSVGIQKLLEYSKATMADTHLHDGYDLGAAKPFTMWENPRDPLHYRLLQNSRLWRTFDGWTTLADTNPPVIVPTMATMFVPRVSDPDIIFWGRGVADDTDYPHILYVQDGEGGTPLPRAGADPVGGVDSIPYNCGGLARITEVACAGGGGLAVF
jgi:hypothetical protein